MRYDAKAKLHKVVNNNEAYVLAKVQEPKFVTIFERYATNGIVDCDLFLHDGRQILTLQRQRAYATLADIADHTGYHPEELKEIMKYRYIGKTGEDYFSLSNCSVSTARGFITYIVDFAIEWGIPLGASILERTDDINAALYSALKHKKCILCGKDGEIHHWQAIGIGRDRTTYADSSHEKICLCRQHHTLAHSIGKKSFKKKYHVYGIIYNEAG